jgi:tRNA(adenine34) deaminase
MNLSATDVAGFRQAVRLALAAEQEGNLPIGAVITLDGQVIAEGQNAIWFPRFNPNRHAEIEALRNVPAHLWQQSRQMTLYTTLEPCLMCFGAILLHHVGRVLYGSADHYGGAVIVQGHLPTYFEDEALRAQWIGPAYPEACDPLFARAMKLVEKRRVADPNR